MGASEDGADAESDESQPLKMRRAAASAGKAPPAVHHVTEDDARTWEPWSSLAVGVGVGVGVGRNWPVAAL